MDPSTWKSRVEMCASTAFFGSRAWVGSLLSQVNSTLCSPGGDYLPHCAVSFVTVDETPLPFRTADFQKTRHFPEMPDAIQDRAGVLPGATDAPTPGGKKGRRTCKVIQSDSAFSICLKRRAAEEYLIIEIPVVQPLQLVDRCTAETLAACQSESSYIPMWAAFRDMFPHNFDVSTTDLAAPNVKADRFSHVLSNANLHRFQVRIPGNSKSQLQVRSSTEFRFELQVQVRDPGPNSRSKFEIRTAGPNSRSQLHRTPGPNARSELEVRTRWCFGWCNHAMK